jgi:protein TonB
MLTISIVAHTAVIVGVVAMGIASVDFPAAPPDEYMLAPTTFAVHIPPPLGNPNGGAKPQAVQQPAQKPQAQVAPPTELTAPSTVPNDVPQLEAASSIGPGERAGEATGSGTEPGPVGVPWGVDGGVGDPNAPPAVAATPQVEERIYQAHEVVAPVALYKPAPAYPQMLLKTGLKATVIVRCIIDKNGRVRDAEVLKPGPMAAFGQSVLDTVATWRYKPGSLNGVAVETYLNVTVHFSVN